MDQAQAETVVTNILQKMRSLNIHDEQQVTKFRADLVQWLIEHGVAQPMKSPVDLRRSIDNAEAKDLMKNLDHLANEHMEEVEELVVNFLEGGDYTGAVQAIGFHQGCRSMREEIRGIMDSEFSED